MLVFPQLATGASGPYPLKKTSRQRSIVNTLGDGRTDVYADPNAATVEWELNAKGLTAAEWNAIETLFQTTMGMWGSFTFLDPVGNLLAESENLGASAWTNGPLINLTQGMGDPFGSTRATRAINGGQAVQSVEQALNVPGNFHYCMSVWARTNSGSSITLSISTVGGDTTKMFALTSQWQRFVLATNLKQSTMQVIFSVQLNAAASIDLFAMQVEAQLSPSDYKQTGTNGGIYPNARFAEDTITVTAQGTDLYDTVIRIVSMEN